MSEQIDPHGLADLARDLQGEATSAGTFDHVVKAALQSFPGASSVSVSTSSKQVPLRTEASTDALAARGDQLQHELSQGPCLDAAIADDVVRSDDLAQEGRWPRWSAQVVEELGARSMLCLRLFTADHSFGALNLYATTPHAFTDDDVALAEVFVAHCTVAIAQAQEVDNLRLALDSRTAIANAVGMLMKEHRLTATGAFEVLVRHSSRQNRKVVDIAADLIRAHTREITVTDTLRSAITTSTDRRPNPGPRR